MPAKITAWSYSRWMTYEECPFKAKLKFIERRQEPSAPALERGTAIHKLAEEYLTGVKSRLPAELKQLKTDFAAVRKVEGIQTEMEVALTTDWKFTEWFAPDAWCRIKIDLFVPPKTGATKVVDFKTGRYRPGTYVPQLELYAIPALIKYPNHDTNPEFWFIDHGIVHAGDPPLSFTIGDLPRLRKIWERRVKPMLADTKFAPRPGAYCRWCHFAKAKGGPCKF